jgi:hypothetical protein
MLLGVAVDTGGGGAATPPTPAGAATTCAGTAAPKVLIDGVGLGGEGLGAATLGGAGAAPSLAGCLDTAGGGAVAADSTGAAGTACRASTRWFEETSVRRFDGQSDDGSSVTGGVETARLMIVVDPPAAGSM